MRYVYKAMTQTSTYVAIDWYTVTYVLATTVCISIMSCVIIIYIYIYIYISKM